MVGTLLDKINEACSIDQNPTGLLLISQPNTAGKSRIPGTTHETNAVMNIMSPTAIQSLLLEGDAATASRVKNEMNTHSWVHFACHAVQDQKEPLKSRFYLDDGPLELLEIIRQKFPKTDHAFLSACQTSTGDEKLSDEAVHLAAGMLAAGYRGVVATMWSIDDKHAPQIALNFYSQLLDSSSGEQGKKLEVSRAAYALDNSIKKIRDSVGNTEDGLLTWVPYVHFGI